MNIRTLIVLLAVAIATTASLAQTSPPASPPPPGTNSVLKTEKERIAYAIGLQIGSSLHGVELDVDAFAKGVKDSNGGKPILSQDEIAAAMAALQQQLRAKAQAEQSVAADKNQKLGDAYLADNLKKEGVKATASGLQYKVLKSGKGKSPKPTDTVSVNYRGSLISGKEFDASKDGPMTIPINRVIPGWTEALQLMKEGDKWQLYIPSKLAYGPTGAGEDIGPNEVLIFDVELLEVK